MYSNELKVNPNSEYYIYAPSTLAEKLYLYPLSTGYFYYEPEYFISRNSFDSFLIMYITKGQCTIFQENNPYTAKTGDFVLIDCYKPHRYGNHKAWEALWLHFDGPLAHEYYLEITATYGNILTPNNSQKISQIMNKIYILFRTKQLLIEAVLSRMITDILDGLLHSSYENKHSASYNNIIADSISYINEHFNEDITLSNMAEKANLSPFYFSRIFTKETGFTPHQYLIHTRLSTAKFMLKSSETSIKNIAFTIGFKSESSFCSTFKKWENLTPKEYREKILF